MGEAESNARLAAEHHESLFRWAQALARWDREEAMEIVQQTYLEVMEGRADLSAARDPKRFLFGVARKIAASRNRRRSVWGRILRFQLAPESSVPPTQDPGERIDSAAASVRTRALFSRLTARQLEAITLVFNEGLTVEEAAKAMGVSVGSARTHYHRGKERLKQLLGERQDD